MTTDALVRMEHISKAYGRVQALDDVTMNVREREIVGLLGDNGAGKSTLIKVLSGAVRATSGQIFIRRQKVDIKSTSDAIRHGIETIYQDSALVTQLSIARNLFLGREPLRAPGLLNRMDQGTMNRVAGDLLRRVGITKAIPPTTPISSLSGGERPIGRDRARHAFRQRPHRPLMSRPTIWASPKLKVSCSSSAMRAIAVTPAFSSPTISTTSSRWWTGSSCSTAAALPPTTSTPRGRASRRWNASSPEWRPSPRNGP